MQTGSFTIADNPEKNSIDFLYIGGEDLTIAEIEFSLKSLIQMD